MNDKIAPSPMERIELRFSGTYYFVYTLDSFISRPDIVTRAFSDHFHEGIEAYVTPFCKWTALHVFIEFFVDQVIFEDHVRASGQSYVRRDACLEQFCRSTPAWLLASDLMASHGFDVTTFQAELDQWVEPNAHCCPEPLNGLGPDFDLWEEVDSEDYYELIQRLAEEVFFVLFANRSFLYKFNEHIAKWVSSSGANSEEGEARDLFRRDRTDCSILKRANIPIWAQRAVFFRDRGRCCTCERDLGGSYSPVNRCQYDHIVPLAVGGLNDVSNLQLLCNECNSKKRARLAEPGQLYERWFPTERQYQPRRVPTLHSVIQDLFSGDH